MKNTSASSVEPKATLSSPSPSPQQQKEESPNGGNPATTDAAERGDERQPSVREREHIVATAGYWFRGSREHQRHGRSAEAIMCMENAYNHVENALAAAQEQLARSVPLTPSLGNEAKTPSVSGGTPNEPVASAVEEEKKEGV